MKKSKLSFYPKNREKTKWKVPTLFNNDKVVLMLHDYCAELQIKQPIHSVYGCAKSAWSGGRISQIDEINEEETYKIISEHNKRNISCCFTFSNYNITEEELTDSRANLLLKIASDVSEENCVIVSSDLLADYIRATYPKIKLISSVIKPVYEHPKYDETPDYYNNLCKKYDKVVVRPEFYPDRSFMKKLKSKKQIEIMPNLGCFRKCPLAKMHYDYTVKWDRGEDTKYKRFCHVAMNDIKSVYKTNIISNEDIDDLIKLGFENFKLKGRGGSDQQVMEFIGSYIFKPTGYFQYLEEVIFNQMLR